MIKAAVREITDSLVARSDFLPLGRMPELPLIEMGSSLPRIIHQTAKSRKMPIEIDRSIERTRLRNPGYVYNFYDDPAVIEYIAENYGRRWCQTYLAINNAYGQARADLFRYLLMYREGGVYLDVKSAVDEPLDSITHSDDKFILSQWNNRRGDKHEGWGLHPECTFMQGGEYQQWHIICVKGHPYLRAVIDYVLERLMAYKPWSDGVGWKATLNTTGPIAYSKAIYPIKQLHPHRCVKDQRALGLRYSIYGDETSHQSLNPQHYKKNKNPLIDGYGLRRWVFGAYDLTTHLR